MLFWLRAYLGMQGRVTGAMGVPVLEQRPGDCYMWGSCEASAGGAGSRGSAGAAPGACAWQHSEAPILVSDAHHLDVAEVGGQGFYHSRPHKALQAQLKACHASGWDSEMRAAPHIPNNLFSSVT